MKITGFSNIKNNLQKIAKKLFNKPVYLFGFLFLVDLVISFILYWQLVLFPIIDNKPQSLLVLNKGALDKFVVSWEKQEEESNSIEGANYPDIFFGFSKILPSTTSQNQ